MLAYLKKQNPEDLIGKKAVFIACDRLESYTGYLRDKRKSLFENKKSEEKLQNFDEKIITQTTENLSQNSSEIVIDMRSNASYEISHIK